jgi:glycosyltransferase involved in cell wall biosynthesis
MGAALPPIGIGVPVYNGGRYLRGSLDSLLDQSFGDFVLLISDNASTDDTADICADYARRDPRVRYVRQPHNLGAPRNWSFVGREAATRYFKWASANDVCHRDLLARCHETLEDDRSAVLAYARTRIIDADDRPLEDYRDVLDLRDPDPCARFIHVITRTALNNAQAGLVRTNALRRTGFLGPFQASDITLLGELSLHGTFREVPEILFYRRMANGAIAPRSHDEYNFFHDPSSAFTASMQFWPNTFARFGAIARGPLVTRQRLQLWGWALRTMAAERSALWHELVDQLHTAARLAIH